MGDAAFSAWRDKGQEQRTLSFLDVKEENQWFLSMDTGIYGWGWISNFFFFFFYLTTELVGS